MPGDEELENDDLETGETEAEEKPALPEEPVDRNDPVEVQVSQPSRKEKKQNRYRELQERLTRAETEAQAARREAQEARQAQQSYQLPQQQQQNPAIARLEQIDQERNRLFKEYEVASKSPGFTDEHRQQYEDRAQRLQTAKMIAVAQAAQAAQPQPDTRELVRQVQWNQFTSEHSDVFNNERARNWGIARWSQLVRGEGRPDTRELAEEILDETRVKFGMQPRKHRGSRPNEATRQKLSGISAQGGSGNDGVSKVEMSRMERKIAEAKYDKLPPKEAWQKWANNEGKRVAQKAAARK